MLKARKATLLNLVTGNAGTDGEFVQNSNGLLSSQIDELSGEGAPVVVHLTEVRVGVVKSEEVGELEAVLEGSGDLPVNGDGVRQGIDDFVVTEEVFLVIHCAELNG
jgi:hypothetical protein